jgi:hypothetical protein
MAMKNMMRRQAWNSDEVVFNLTQIEKSGQTPEWEEDHEFRLNGKMYDVIEKKIENDQLIVRCISDDKETELTRKYEELLESQSDDPGKKQAASIIKLITSPFTIPTTFIPAIIKDLPPERFPYYCFGTLTSSREVITPPPQLL